MSDSSIHDAPDFENRVEWMASHCPEPTRWVICRLCHTRDVATWKRTNCRQCNARGTLRTDPQWEATRMARKHIRANTYDQQRIARRQWSR